MPDNRPIQSGGARMCYKKRVGGSLSGLVGQLKKQRVAVASFAQWQQDVADVGDAVDEQGVGIGRTYCQYIF